MVQSEEMRAQFSRRLSEAMDDAGWKSHGRGARLAKIAKTSPKAASKWLNAEAIPRAEKLQAIANALEVSRNWLQYGEGEKARSPAAYPSIMEGLGAYAVRPTEKRQLLALLNMIDSEYSAGNLEDSDLSAIMAMAAALSSARRSKS